MATTVQLLGPPLLIRDGVVYAAPRGRKVWAVLAYLALSQGQPSRQQLIDLLFSEAEDPAATLRWNLSELRRLLGGPDTVGSGHVVQLRLPAGSVIDVHVLMGGTSGEAVELPGLGRELLEGMDIDASPGLRRVAPRRTPAPAGAERGRPARRSAPCAGVRRRTYRGRPGHAAGGGRPAERRRARAAGAGVRCHRRRGRRRGTALRVDRSVPPRAGRGTRFGADRRGHDRGAHGRHRWSAPVEPPSRRSWNRARLR